MYQKRYYYEDAYPYKHRYGNVTARYVRHVPASEKKMLSWLKTYNRHVGPHVDTLMRAAGLGAADALNDVFFDILRNPYDGSLPFKYRFMKAVIGSLYHTKIRKSTHWSRIRRSKDVRKIAKAYDETISKYHHALAKLHESWNKPYVSKRKYRGRQYTITVK